MSGKRSRYKRNLIFAVWSLFFYIIGVFIGVGCSKIIPSPSANQRKVNKSVNLSFSPVAFAAEEGSMSIPEVVKKVGPAVVGVSTRSIVQNGARYGMGVQEGIGSGFIINSDGYVLTNYHVISGASEVKVIFNDGREINSKVVNYEPNQDIAVVKLEDGTPVPGVVELGNSDALQAGESVLAIGNPLGKEFIGSVTAGIISAVNRDIDIQGRKLSLIQTDAAINPGNSGGPLLNSQGQVIGVNTAKIGAEGVEGIGFSIPINIVKSKLEALSRPLLKIGIAGINITEEMAAARNLPSGVYIKEIQSGSSAEKAGLKEGDIVVKFNDTEVKTIDDINSIKSQLKSGDTVNIVLVRNNKRISTDLTLSE